MSRPQVNSRVSEEMKDGVEQLKNDRGYGSQSDAARRALRVGLAELGYLSSGVGITPARKIARHAALMLCYTAAILMFLTASTALSFLLPAVGIAVGSGTMAGVDRWLLPAIEPAASNLLPRIEVSSRGG